MDAGAGDLWELRSTDIDIAKCRRRYEVFKARSKVFACAKGRIDESSTLVGE